MNAHSVVRLGATQSGVLQSIDADRGDTVIKGQVLAQLESSAQEAALRVAQMEAGNSIPVELARTRLATARAQAARMTTLSEQNLIRESEAEDAMLEAETAALELQQAQFDFELAAAELEAAEAALERRRVRAPFDGVVTERFMAVGEVYNSEPIMALVKIDPLHVEAYLPAASRDTVRVGQTVEVEFESGATETGTIAIVDPVLDAATGTFGLRVAVANPDGRHLAGQRCRVMLIEGK